MTRKLCAIAAAAAMMVGATAADATITVDWSFTGTNFSAGFKTATVSGHMTFDAPGQNVAATGVYLDSITGAVVDPSINYAGATGPNIFAVNPDGSIGMANFAGSDDASSSIGATTILTLLSPGSSTYFGPVGLIVGGETSFSTASAAPVPEPATWAMMLGGMGLLGGAMRRRQRVSVRFA